MPASAIPPNIGEIAGPLLIGYFLNWFLLGGLSAQVYVYYLAFPDDFLPQQLAVLLVFVLEALQTVLSTRDAFREFASGWGNIDQFVQIGWLWFSVPILAAILCFLVQVFYARRIHILSKTRWLPIVICGFSVTQFAGGIYEGAVGRSTGNITQLQDHGIWTTCWRISSSLACDLVIVAGMVYYLSKSRSLLRIGRSHTILARLSGIALETGLLCAIFATVDLALFLSVPGTTYHLTPAIVVSKLYSNSMLAVLNARLVLNGGRNQPPDTNDAMPSFPTDIRFTYHNSSTQTNTSTSSSLLTPSTGASSSGIKLPLSKPDGVSGQVANVHELELTRRPTDSNRAHDFV